MSINPNFQGGSPRRMQTLLAGLLMMSSVSLVACDMGSSPPASGVTQNPPTAAQPSGGNQQPATGSNQQPTTASNQQPGATGFQPGGVATGGTPAGNAGGTAGFDQGPNVIAGAPAPFTGKLAAAVPIAGTDPSQQPIVQMVQRVDPGVVTVVSTISGGEARGSGAIIDQQGYIVTNNHVVDQTQRLRVIFSNGKVQDAQLVGTARGNDLAVLKIAGPVPAVIKLGDSNQLMPGEVVIAIGSALGEFRDTVTVGVVSGLHRTLPEGNGVEIQDLIQTDAAINHGNSGGPLLNLAGELVGINTLGVTSAGQGDIAQGLGFSIPSKTVSVVVGQILKGGGGTANAPTGRPRLGVQIQPVDPQTAGYYNLVGPDGQLLTDGELITQVVAGGPAAAAGVKAMDVIIGVNNQQVGANNRLGDVLLNFKPGDKITLVIIRAGKQGTIQVTLGQPQ